MAKEKTSKGSNKTKATEIEIGISEKSRKQVADGLSSLLADSYILYLKTHNFHWNVEGPMFNTLHIMFMEQYTEMWNALDLIAERIRSLGSYAPGSYRKYHDLSSIDETDDVPGAKDMIKLLLKGHESVAKTARKIIPLAESCDDEVTLDLLTQRLQIHEKTAWMLRSLLSEK